MTSNLKSLRFLKTTFKVYLALVLVVGGVIVFAPAGKNVDLGFVNSFEILGNGGSVDVVGEDSSNVFVEFDELEDFYIFPGEEKVNVAHLTLAPDNLPIRLIDLTLKVNGVDVDDMSGFYLIDERGKRYEGVVDDSYVTFEGFYKKIWPEESYAVSVYCDFSKDVEVGSRFNLSLENPGDVHVSLMGERVLPEEDYPIKGEYLSVIGGRL